MDDLSSSSSLEILDLDSTNMIGSLPSEMFYAFPKLHTFIISHNKMDGSLPQSLGKSAISYLQLNNQLENKFSGTIDVISSMSNLCQVWLHNNSFTGRIPIMSNCTNLFDLQLQSNDLTGFVPSSLLNLSSLKIIFLDNNKLHRPMPAFYKGVVKATLEPNNFCRSAVGPCDPQVMTLLEIFEAFGPDSRFSIKGNDACTGGQWTDITTDQVLIRCERGKIVTFKIRDFNHFLPGTISPAFSKLTSLVNLTLAGNYLNGSIPDSLKTLPQLQLLDVSNNNLSGVIPKFSSKVKLNTTGNALLDQNMSKANLKPVIWITGASVIIVGFVVLIALIICKQMIGGRKNYDTGGSCTSEMYFPDWIYKDLEQGNNLENSLANPNQENDMVRQITMVSLWCIQMSPSDRPSMSKVLEMLQGSLQSVPYPPKPFLHSPQGPSLQTSFVSSSNLLETNSIEIPVKM
ncbi:non-specific serine/threonine protein kinase [Trifolium repens]|nr:non-specific serine/threonine protein kinase [Trifolium repens]